MSATTKRLLIIISLAAVFCVVAVVAAVAGMGLLANRVMQGVTTEPAKVQTMTSAFIHYKLPPGYTEQMGMDILIYKMILIGPTERGSGSPIIFLAHFQGQDLSPEEMTRQMRQSVEQQSGRNGLNMKVVATRKVTIAGQESTLTISEGTDDVGDTLRQWITAFPGKKGTILVLIQGRIDEWDDADLNAFLASITI